MTIDPNESRSVTRDVYATSRFMDTVRGTLPACVVCNKPSGYRDIDGNWSHAMCAGESSERALQAKIAARGGKIASDAGPLDLDTVVRMAEQHSAGPKAKLDQAGRITRRDGSVVMRMPGTSTADRSVIKKMSERAIYDSSTLRYNPMDPHDGDRQLIDRALRAVELADFGSGNDQDQVRSHIEKLLKRGSEQDFESVAVARRILITGNPYYRSAFIEIIDASMRGIDAQAVLDSQEKKAVQHFSLDQERAMTVGAGSQGGFAVPFTLDPTIMGISNGSVNPFRKFCRVETITTNEWRGLTSGGLTLAYAAEAAVTSDNSPTLAQPTVATNRAQGFIPVSNELFSDWASVLDQLGAEFQRAKDDLEADRFTLGTGMTQPQGLATGATTTVATTSGGAFVLADLPKLEEAVPPRFRPRSVIFGNRAQINRAQQFAAPNEVDVYQPLPDTGWGLWGYPYAEATAMVSTITGGSKILVMGDPAYFVIVDRIGMDIEVIQYLFDNANFRPSGQRGLFCFFRNGSAVLNANAFRTLQT